MATYRDYIPRDQLGFNDWQLNFIELLQTHGAKWSIPEADIKALEEWQAAYQPLFEAGNKMNRANRTNVQAVELHMARIAYEKALREFIGNNIRFNKSVSNAQKVALLITVPDTTRTPRGTPTTVPMLSTSPVKGARIQLIVQQQPGAEGTSRRAKPKDVARIEVAVFVGADAPPKPEAFPVKSQWGRTTIRLDFKPEEAGSPVSVCCRFIGFNNKPGPWGMVKKEIVPM